MGEGPAMHLSAIPLHVPHRLAHLEILAHVIANQFADDSRYAAILDEAAVAIGYRPTPLSVDERNKVDFEKLASVIGWYHPKRLEQLIHREWLATSTNEFAQQVSTLMSFEIFSQAKTIEIVGAGVCRLALELAALPQEPAIRCTDLSFLALDLGRLLLHRQGETMPAAVRAPIRMLNVRGSRSLIASEIDPHYVAGDSALAARVDYAVVDAMWPQAASSGTQTTADLVVVPFLIDAFPVPLSALVQATSAYPVGQRLMVMVTLAANREPVQITQTLEACGWEIEHLELTRWPYSLSRHDWAYTSEVTPVLLVQARRNSETIADQLEVQPNALPQTMSEAATRALMPGLRHRGQIFGQREMRALAKALTTRRYAAFRHALREELGVEEAANLNAWLVGRGFLAMHLAEVPTRFFG